jgi:hypothetical protein
VPLTALRAPVRIGVAALMVVSAALYLRVGWWRMESACPLDDAHGPLHSSVAYGWSWQPLGFRCTYDDGGSRTSVWF